LQNPSCRRDEWHRARRPKKSNETVKYRRQETVRRTRLNRAVFPPLSYRNVAPAAAKAKVRTVGTYRLYCLDGVGKVMSAEWIDADGDKTAIEAAMKQVDGYAYELWDHSRLVMRIDPNRGNGVD
jgi:hypothetical protein